MKTYAISSFLGALLALAALILSASSAAAAAPPRGSYQTTCWGVVAEQGTLRAYCRRNDGSFRLTFLPNYLDCRGDIRNSNGRLECTRRGSFLPPGDWYMTCRNARIAGPLLSAECRNRVGVWLPSQINYRQCLGEIRNVNGRLVCDVDYRDLPRGDWIRSCRNYRLDGWVLKAECRNDRGAYRYSELNIRNCRDDVSNVDGRLVCGRDGSFELPPGSWTRSCRDGYVENGTLFAECRDNRGRWRNSVLDLRGCRRQPVSNQDGVLTCGDGTDGRLPPGSWRDSCRNWRMDGSFLEAECQDRSGAWRFTDIDTRDCAGGIANRNGRLVCEDSGGPEIIRCESNDNRYKFCPVRTGADVELHRQLSLTPCVRDQSWGRLRDGIWVDNGCRGEFRVEDRRY